MGLFAAVSLLLAVAPTVFWLDLLRGAQGVAAAAALAGGTAALAQEFDGHARTRAFSLLGTTFGVGLAFGPLLSGVLIEWMGWRGIFLFTALLALVSLVFAVPNLRESRNPHAQHLDTPGVLAFSGLLIAFTSAVILAPGHGWNAPLIQALLAVSVVLAAVFAWVETRARQPMLELRLLRFPRFVGVQILPIGTCYCFIVLVVLLPIRFIGVESLSAFDAGLRMFALSAPMLLVPMLAARYKDDRSIAFLDMTALFMRNGQLDRALFLDPRLTPPDPPLHPSCQGWPPWAMAMKPAALSLSLAA